MNTQGVGVGITVLRRATVLASVALRRRMLVTLEINNKDRSYAWFLAWLAHHQRTARRPAWAHSHQLSVETAYEQRSNGSADVCFSLVAGPGVHWLKYRGAWMQVRPPPLPPSAQRTPLLITRAQGETRARDARDADGLWHAVGDRHADDALPRPRAVRAAAGGGTRCGDARAGGPARRAHCVGRRVASVRATSAPATAAQRRPRARRRRTHC